MPSMNRSEILRRHLTNSKETVGAFAKRAGVSRVTVFRYLAGRGVNLATHERVQAAIAETEALRPVYATQNQGARPQEAA